MASFARSVAVVLCVTTSFMVCAQDKPGGPVAPAGPANIAPTGIAQATASRANGDGSAKSVTLVLGGGGAKGFAHLAVLRRLEQDHVKIGKIIGTSMGAVIGGLYASGMGIDDIETFVQRMDDPFKVALDQVDRTELSHRARAYQQQYPVNLELGVKNGQISFARGVSDGQRLLTVLQELTANVPPNADFDKLKIPFRAIATRYADGTLAVLDHGNLALALRASSAAPAVFAPVEIDGQTFVDGGLVANLPVEVALKEAPDSVIVASWLGDNVDSVNAEDSANALIVANRMISIMMRQNERRSVTLLRSQDVLVRPRFQGLGSGDFDKAGAITAVGQQAVEAEAEKFRQLAQTAAHTSGADAEAPVFNEREITISTIRVTGNELIPAAYVEKALAHLVGTPYQPATVAQALDALYASGNFERLNYTLEQIAGKKYTLTVDVNEKTYGPNYFRTSLGFFSEVNGTNMFSVGLGYRRPWLTPSGLELSADVGVGAHTNLGVHAFQPFGSGWGLDAFAEYKSQELPLYRPDYSTPERMAMSTIRKKEIGLDLSYDFNKKFTVKAGLSVNQTSISIDTAKNFSLVGNDGKVALYNLQDSSDQFTSANLELTADQLDSASFPTRGYYADLSASRRINRSTQAESWQLKSLWAWSLGPHVVNLGLDWGVDYTLDCDGCNTSLPMAPLFLGGFQAMGAWQFGQLNGDHLAHLQSTYMYRLYDGGVLRQRTYVGMVLEAGDAWMHTQSMSLKTSATVFLAMDSKIGDIYFGLATGSGGNRNIFVQLGRRFTAW